MKGNAYSSWIVRSSALLLMDSPVEPDVDIRLAKSHHITESGILFYSPGNLLHSCSFKSLCIVS